MLRIRPRYYRWFVDPGVDWTEANTDHAFLDWEVPISQVALVLVDVWNSHYLKDTMARSERINQEILKPLVEGCRRHGLRVIHAPQPSLAKPFPQWVGHRREKQTPQSQDAGHSGGQSTGLQGIQSTGSQAIQSAGMPRRRCAGQGDRQSDIHQAGADEGPSWPPADFREGPFHRRKGKYAAYGHPEEPRTPELIWHREERKAVHPDFLPQEDEIVVATGEELHEVCAEEGILVLLYAGYNTNACILERDYGLPALSRKGYACVLVRDCTTAMESRTSQKELVQTRAAIERIEMFFGYTVTAEDVLKGME